MNSYKELKQLQHKQNIFRILQDLKPVKIDNKVLKQLAKKKSH